MADNTQGGQGYPGQMGLTDPQTGFNATAFQIWAMLGDVRTIVPVEVVAVTGGGTAGPCMVDVHPLINQVDGALNSTPHGNVLDLAVVRWQAGTSAVILDPVVGDIGLALIADRDISALKASKAQSNPGSRRRFNLADGIYLGGILGPAVTKYIQFTDNGITVSGDLMTGNIAATGNITATGSIIAGLGGPDQVSLQTHVHPSNGQPPTPGT